MECDFLGPMPVKEFFRKFLPTKKLSEEDRTALPGFVAIANTEGNTWFDEFVRHSLQPVYFSFPIFSPRQVFTVNSYCSNIKAHNPPRIPWILSYVGCGPDIFFYDSTKNLPEGRVATFQQMELFIELEQETASDPFTNTDKSGTTMPFERLSYMARATRVQMAMYSARMQMYQFRTCVFSVGIFGKVARLFRWDRAGAIVSAPIEYSTAGNRELAEFFYRFNRMNPVQRGWDPTVCDATAEDAAAFTQAIQTVVGGGNGALLKSLLESVGKPEVYPRKKINVIYGGGKRASYIAGRSSVIAKSPTGRATRCFVAMDVETKGLAFLKDSWRMGMPGMKSEGHWYKRLKRGEYLAAFSHGSDVGRVKRGGNVKKGERVRPQRTVTQNYFKRYCNTLRAGFIHYRTVQSEFYIPLKMFKDSKNLTQIMYDIVLGEFFLSAARHFTTHPTFSNTGPLRNGDPSSRYKLGEHYDHRGRPGSPHRL